LVARFKGGTAKASDLSPVAAGDPASTALDHHFFSPQFPLPTENFVGE
jgi:hypothetical protein